jgi:hypothetical protein
VHFEPKEPGAISGGIVKRDDVSRTPQVTVNVASTRIVGGREEVAGGPTRAVYGVPAG